MAKSKKKKSTKPASGKAKSSKPAPTPPPEPKKPKVVPMADADLVAAQKAKEKRKVLVRRALIGVAIVAGVALIAWAALKIKEVSELPNPQAKPAKHYPSPSGTTKTGLTVGNEQAPVTVELYLDYNCPHCKEFEDKIGKDIQKRVDAGEIKVIYHPIARLTPYSVLASAAAGCAQDAGKFVEYNAELFEHQTERLNESKLKKLGKNVGLTSGEFKDCVDDRKYENWTLGLNQEAIKREVVGTPTVFVGEEELIPSTSMKSFVKEVKAEIDKQQAAVPPS